MILYISPRFSNRPNGEQLIQVAKKLGIRTDIVAHQFRATHEKSRMDIKTAMGAVYGEHAFCEFVAQEMRWNLYSNCLDWVTKIPYQYSRRGILYGTLGDMRTIQGINQSILNQKILEPADDNSFVMGKYVTKFPEVPEQTRILAHDETEWKAKYRAIIVNGKLEDICCYRIVDNSLETHGEIAQYCYTAKGVTAMDFIGDVLKNNTTAPACILDVGAIENGWAVIGTYPIWTSDYYACSPVKFLKALFASCEKR